MPTKEQILEASKDCPDAKEVLKKLFPEAFEEGSTLTVKFKSKARIHMSELKGLIYDELMENDNDRARWIIANFLYSSIPSKIDDELGNPYEKMREDN